MTIELVSENDFEELSKMIQETCRISFENFYPNEWIEYTISRQTIERLKDKANKLHFYVAKEGCEIVGCGAIGDYYGKKDESCLFSFFVKPNMQGKGVGKEIMNKLEKDNYFVRAKKVYVPSSIPAVPFYKKMGYDFKDGKMIFEDGSFLLEKIK